MSFWSTNTVDRGSYRVVFCFLIVFLVFIMNMIVVVIIVIVIVTCH